MLTLHNLLLLTFPLLMLVAAFADLTSLRVPNLVVMALILGYIVAGSTAKLSDDDWIATALTGIACLVIGFVAFSQNWIGGGDAKLLAAMGLWLGPDATIMGVLIGAFAAGGMGVLILGARRYVPLTHVPDIWRQMIETKTIPYAAALAVGGLWAYPESPIWITTFR
jgi:prepilin peptidase CpaA